MVKLLRYIYRGFVLSFSKMGLKNDNQSRVAQHLRSMCNIGNTCKKDVQLTVMQQVRARYRKVVYKVYNIMKVRISPRAQSCLQRSLQPRLFQIG